MSRAILDRVSNFKHHAFASHCSLGMPLDLHYEDHSTRGCLNSWRKTAFSMYYSLWNIRKVTSHSYSDCSSDQGTLKEAIWQLGSEYPSSYGILKASIASQTLTTTGDARTQLPSVIRNIERRIEKM
jgi:hypothetical protein